MGYEYDFLFDWMVKKSSITQVKPGEEEKKEETGIADQSSGV